MEMSAETVLISYKYSKCFEESPLCCRVFEKIYQAGYGQKNQKSLSKAEEKSLQHRTKKAFLL